jgi:hypothetical protein
MNNQLIINTSKLDIAKQAEFAKLVEQAKQAQVVLDSFWLAVKDQMTERNVDRLEGNYGAIQFETAELLVVTDAEALDPGVTKPALDTKKVRAYRELMGELPAGVGVNTITKFAKRLKK